MPSHYIFIIRHDDDSPAELFDLGGDFDARPVYEERRKRGNLDPIGSAWGTSCELWVESDRIALKLHPLFVDDVQELWDNVFNQGLPRSSKG